MSKLTEQKQATDFFVVEDQSLLANAKQKNEVDAITESIRENILKKQSMLLNSWLNDANQKQMAEKELQEYLKNKDNVQKILANPELKKQFENIEVQGYRAVLNDQGIKAKMQDLTWDNQNEESRSKIVKNAQGEQLCTLIETTKKVAFQAVNDQGENVEVASYRFIDFPKQLAKDGPMHLAIAVKDKNGHNIAEDKAVYFTAHYDKAGNLAEISSPQPIKFMGKGDDAIGYIAHQGEIYTLPVTQGKYQEMLQNVAKNKGLATDLSQKIEVKNKPLAQDKVMTIEAEIKVEQQKEVDNKSALLVKSAEKQPEKEAPKKENFIDKLKNVFEKVQNSVKKLTKNENINALSSNPETRERTRTANPNIEIANKFLEEKEKIKNQVSGNLAGEYNLMPSVENKTEKSVTKQGIANSVNNQTNTRPVRAESKKQALNPESATLFEKLPTPVPTTDKKQTIKQDDQEVDKKTRARSYSEGARLAPDSKPIGKEVDHADAYDVVPSHSPIDQLKPKDKQAIKGVKHNLQETVDKTNSRPRANSRPPVLKKNKSHDGRG